MKEKLDKVKEQSDQGLHMKHIRKALLHALR